MAAASLLITPCNSLNRRVSSTALPSRRVKDILDAKAVGGLFPHSPRPASMSRGEGATPISHSTSLLSCQRSSAEPSHSSSRCHRASFALPPTAPCAVAQELQKHGRSSVVQSPCRRETAALWKIRREDWCLGVSTAMRRNPCRHVLSSFPSPL